MLNRVRRDIRRFSDCGCCSCIGAGVPGVDRVELMGRPIGDGGIGTMAEVKSC